MNLTQKLLWKEFFVDDRNVVGWAKIRKLFLSASEGHGGVKVLVGFWGDEKFRLCWLIWVFW